MPGLHPLTHDGDLRFSVGQDPLHDHPMDIAFMGQHRLRAHKGSHAQDPWMVLDHFGYALPMVQWLTELKHARMGGHAEDTFAQLLFKAVHYRQHRDKRSDAQSHADHRDQGDEGDEMVTPFGAGIAQADVKFERFKHGGRLYPKVESQRGIMTFNVLLFQSP